MIATAIEGITDMIRTLVTERPGLSARDIAERLELYPERYNSVRAQLSKLKQKGLVYEVGGKYYSSFYQLPADYEVVKGLMEEVEELMIDDEAAESKPKPKLPLDLAIRHFFGRNWKLILFLTLFFMAPVVGYWLGWNVGR